MCIFFIRNSAHTYLTLCCFGTFIHISDRALVQNHKTLFLAELCTDILIYLPHTSRYSPSDLRCCRQLFCSSISYEASWCLQGKGSINVSACVSVCIIYIHAVYSIAVWPLRVQTRKLSHASSNLLRIQKDLFVVLFQDLNNEIKKYRGYPSKFGLLVNPSQFFFGNVCRTRHICTRTWCTRTLKVRSLTIYLCEQAVMKSLTLQFLTPARELKTLHQIFKELNKEQPPRRHGQRPLILFLGGGMAAGMLYNVCYNNEYGHLHAEETHTKL